MNWGKLIAAAWITFLFVVLGGLFFGFSQMGDCHPEPQALRQCLDAKDRSGIALLIVIAAVYFSTLWLLFRRQKAQ